MANLHTIAKNETLLVFKVNLKYLTPQLNSNNPLYYTLSASV